MTRKVSLDATDGKSNTDAGEISGWCFALSTGRLNWDWEAFRKSGGEDEEDEAITGSCIYCMRWP